VVILSIRDDETIFEIKDINIWHSNHDHLWEFLPITIHLTHKFGSITRIEGREGLKENINEERAKESLGRKFRCSLGSKGDEVIHGRTLKHKNTIRDRQGTRKRRLLLGEGGPYYEVGGACLIVYRKIDWSWRSGALFRAWHKGEKEARDYDIRGVAWMCGVLRGLSLMPKKGPLMN